MEGLARFVAFILILEVLLLIMTVTGRPLMRESAFFDQISDGVDEGKHKHSSFLLLKEASASSEECEQIYGFLPCSFNGVGHLFLIVVYEYLLFHGESYVASGGQRIFKLQGPGVFGASAFHVLGFLPEAIILLASGLLDSKEVAQEYVFTGVGLLAGSTTLLLTVLWGTCIIIASQEFPNPSVGSNIRQNLLHRSISYLTGCGITTDSKTKYMARIMVLSLIPFVIIQIPEVIQLSSSGEQIVVIMTLIISVLFLLTYFFYQAFQPWIQKRTLEYVKHEHFVVDVLTHMQRNASRKLLTDDGVPNVPAIRRLFEEIDQDGNNVISLAELKELLLEFKFKEWLVDKDRKVAEVMKEFDVNGDGKITMDEFVNGFTKWLDEAKHAMDKKYHSVKSLKHLYEILQPWIELKRKEHQMKKHLISEILEYVQSSALGSLLLEDGRPDILAIKRLFANIDLDGDNCLSQNEMRELIKDINFSKIPMNPDEIVTKIMEELDINGDEVITEEEFVAGFSTWLDIASNQAPESTEFEEDLYEKKWEETDLLVEDRNVDRSLWEWAKAIAILAIGVAMLAVLAEPLIQSVESFSGSANIPSFFIAFILVPLATNARAAIAAIKTVRQKKLRTTSLTFSEIYGGVLMNNILGFSVLLSLVCFRGLSWHFSAEILAVIIVCATVGIAASLTSTFPIWTSVVAYLLYPFSLLLVYALDDVFR